MTEVLTYDPFEPAVHDDPYPTYHALRAADPVHRSELMDMWVLTRHRDIAFVLRDPRFSVDRREWDGTPPPADGELTQSMLSLDPPDHTRLRTLVSRAFTPRVVERLRPLATTLVDEALDRAAHAGGLELVEDLAYPLPVAVIAHLLGVPREDWPRFRAWSRLLVGSLDPTVARDPDRMGPARAAERALHAYLEGVVAERLAEPRDDLISALVAPADGAPAMRGKELLLMLALLLVAGHETTVNLIGNGVLALLRHPDQLALLRARPELVEQAVEELLRWDSPVQLTGRLATSDVEVGGRTVRTGELALTVLGAANRDPEVFTDPDRLDLTRPPGPHLAFGRGIHFCLGAPLARLEGQVAIAALVGRFPGLHEAGEPERSETITMRGLRRLPLEV